MRPPPFSYVTGFTSFSPAHFPLHVGTRINRFRQLDFSGSTSLLPLFSFLSSSPKRNMYFFGRFSLTLFTSPRASPLLSKVQKRLLLLVLSPKGPLSFFPLVRRFLDSNVEKFRPGLYSVPSFAPSFPFPEVEFSSYPSFVVHN